MAITTVKIKMNDNTEFIEDIEGYNPAELTEELNGNRNFINIGSLIVQRFSIVHVTPVEDKPIEDTDKGVEEV